LAQRIPDAAKIGYRAAASEAQKAVQQGNARRSHGWILPCQAVKKMRPAIFGPPDDTAANQ
jgi:hypothetical protein